MIGLYFHVPFCDGKCPYCDFYSLRAEKEQMDRYLRRMEELLSDSGTGEPVGTVYLVAELQTCWELIGLRPC